MATRAELIAAARQEQLERLKAVQPLEQVKPAMCAIGARDPQTGLFGITLPDGQTDLGEQRYNASLPQGTQVLGIPKDSGDGWLLDEQDVVAPLLPAASEAAIKVKVGYVYERTVSGSTPIVCSPTGGGGQNQPIPGNLSAPWYPVPVGSPPITVTVVLDGGTYNGFHSGSGTIGGYTLGTITLTSADYVSSVYTDYAGLAQTIDGSTIGAPPGCASGSYEYRYGGSTIVNGLLVAANYVAAINPDIFFSSTQHVAFQTGSALNPFPTGSTTPGETPPTEDPTNPSTPATTSLEFHYGSDRALTPILLRTLASNQPLEAKPYIIHKSASLSYVILKYGNAANSGGGVSTDWCDISVFAVRGTTSLSVTETVYAWSAANTLEAFLQALPNPFYAIAGSAAQVSSIDPAALVTAGHLDARLTCFTHRNLSNLKRLSVYLLDPVGDTALATLSGDALYGLSSLSPLLTTSKIKLTARYWKLKPNPAYTGSGADCATNPAYVLTEQKRQAVKVNVRGLGSSDSTLVLLTLAAKQL